MNRTDSLHLDAKSFERIEVYDWNDTNDGMHHNNNSGHYDGGEFLFASLEYRAAEAMKRYVTPLLIVAGCVGNTFALTALTKRHLQHNSVCFYFAVLCVLNMLVLLLVYSVNWVSFVSNTPEIQHLGDPVCKIWNFLQKMLFSVVGWLTVASVVDRYLIMWHPVKAQSVCTVFIAKLVMSSIIVTLVSVNIHAMWTLGIAQYEMTHHPTRGPMIQHYCEPDIKNLKAFQIKVWPWIQATLNSYAPMMLAVTFTSILIIGCMYPHGRGDSEHHQMHLTRAAIASGGAYIVLEMPMIVANLVLTFRANMSHGQMLLLSEICSILECLNNAILFALLFASLPLLRYEIWTLLQTVKMARRPLTNCEMQRVLANGSHVTPCRASIEAGSDVTLL